mmetsp:Transcript_55096/g.46440  ORF Transcript_55096/g.46440 Transcript_55096/m.46440 type:complete len:93 (-) Transcript_55096:337-615(-)
MERSYAAVGLYRALLRAAASMPTTNRQLMAADKIRFEFRKSRNETDSETLHELFLIGHTHLDTLETQTQHLNELAKMDMSAIKGVRNTIVRD